jgi:serine/threonine protein kinase
MSSFKPDQEITLDRDTYRIQPHPSAPKLAFAQEGAKGTVYQVIRKSDKRVFALKVFKERFREAEMIRLSSKLADYARLPGMAVCSRQVIHQGGYGSNVLKKYPEFEYAVLMPWSSGRTWFDVISSRASIAPQVGIEIARRTSAIFASLEAASAAHCDASSGNLLIDVNTLEINLIDVEDMYSPQLSKPSSVPHGTDGYNHRQARSDGQWCPEGDRFAAAIIIVEMLCWHSDRIRENSTEDGTYFAPNEMQEPNSAKYQLMFDTLRKIDLLPSDLSERLAHQFEQIWVSQTLAECPKMGSWLSLLEQAPRVPIGTRLTDSEIRWPVIGWKELRSPERNALSPVTSFTQFSTPTNNSIRRVRFMPLTNHDGRGTFTLRWLPVSEAKSYEVTRHQAPDFSDVPTVTHCGETSLLVENTPKGKYFFRVRGVSVTETGPWSFPFQVTVWRD